MKAVAAALVGLAVIGGLLLWKAQGERVAACRAAVRTAGEARAEGRYGVALAEVERAPQCPPEERDALELERALSTLAQGKAKDAVPLLEALTARRPELAPAWTKLGFALVLVERRSEARRPLLQALKAPTPDLTAATYLAELSRLEGPDAAPLGAELAQLPEASRAALQAALAATDAGR